MKRIVLIIMILLCCGCTDKKEVIIEDKFKNEYEKFNNEYLELDIEDSSFIEYINIDDVKDINDGVVFVGSPEDNLSRKVIEILLQVVSGTSLERIYYLNEVSDDYKLSEVIFISNKEIVSRHYGTVEDKIELDDNELLELYNIYSNGIHEVLGDTCDERC